MKSRSLQHTLTVAALLAFSSHALGKPATVYGYSASGAAQFTSMVTSATTASITVPLSKVIANSADGLKSVLVKANADIATQMEHRQIEAIKKERAAQAMQEQQPAADACGAQSHAAYNESVRETKNQIRESGAYVSRVRAAGSPPATEQIMTAEAIHASNYCNPETAPGGVCSGSGGSGMRAGFRLFGFGGGSKSSTSNPHKTGMADADVAAEKSLFSSNLTHTNEQRKATGHFIANVIDSGDVPRKPSKPEYATNEGKHYEGLRQIYLARTSIPHVILNDIAAMRAPLPGGDNVLKEILAGSSQTSRSYVANRVNKLKKWHNGNVSSMELLDIEVGRRIENPEWYEAVNTELNPAALEKEQVLMSALSLKLLYHIYRQIEMMAALDAQQASEAAKAGLQPKLAQAEQAMLRGSSRKSQ